MLSRRRFLQSNAILALPAAKLLGTPPTGPATPPAQTPREYWNDWPEFLSTKMNEARRLRKAALASLSSASSVQERIQQVRGRVRELIGGLLEKTPLDPVIVGTIQRDTYRIEKVIFQSQPQVYVTTNLYIPTAGSGPFPAILCPLGHASNGKAYRNYQYLFQTLARKGYVVLAYDPFGQGERHQYLDPHTGRSRLGPTGEHSQAGRPLLLLGATFAQYRVWDGIRALDYLLSRSEVDPTRVGCTGQSGGGTLTMYLCALEPRLQAAVEVEGNSENLAGPNYDPPGAVADAEQNLIASLPQGIDRGDLLLAFAPKPLLVCYSVQDAGTTYSPTYDAGTKEVFEELQSAYRLLGSADHVQLYTSTLPHGLDFYSRQATYTWFNRWLAKKDLGKDEAPIDTSPPDGLDCTPTGQVLTSLGGRSLVDINSDRLRAVASLSTLLKPSVEAHALRQQVRDRLRRLLALPSARQPLLSRTLSAHTGQGVKIEEIEFRSDPQIRVPGWFIKPQDASQPLPTILFLTEEGKDSIIGEPRAADAFVQQGFAFCSIDLRGLGITTPRYPRAAPLYYGYRRPDISDGYAWASLTLGVPVAGQRVWDFLRGLDYLETRADVKKDGIFVLGSGEAGLAALLGTVLDDRPRTLLLEQTLAGFRAVVESPDYSLGASWFVFGFLRYFDLPDLVGCVAPKPCWLLNPLGARGERLTESTLYDRFQPSLDFYAKNGAEGKLRLLVRSDQERDSLVLSWLRNT